MASYTVAKFTDSRELLGEITVFVENEANGVVHEMTFEKSFTSEYVPAKIENKSADGVDVDFIFNGGMAFACEQVYQETGVEIPYSPVDDMSHPVSCQ